MINTGKLRNRFTIQVPIRVRTVEGGFGVAWAALRTIYCQVQPVSSPNDYDGAWRGHRSGKETTFSAKTRSLVSHRITARTQPEWMTSDMRMVEAILQRNNPNYRVFNIVECIATVNVNEELRIEVMENVSDKDDGTAIYEVMTDDSGASMTDDDREYLAS